MYKKFAIALLLCTLFILSACNSNDEAGSEGEREQNLNELDPTKSDDSRSSFEKENQLGFVHYTKDQIDNDTEDNHVATVDRHKMADMISRIILRSDGFDEVATLVTDREVLIAYGKSDDISDELAADIAKKTALSTMPSFFDVYVTGNTGLVPDIQSLHNSNTQQGDYHNTVESIIKEMKKSPQGMTQENK